MLFPSDILFWKLVHVERVAVRNRPMTSRAIRWGDLYAFGWGWQNCRELFRQHLNPNLPGADGLYWWEKV